MFNKDIDKITERELVYDIVERLTIGKDLSSDTETPKTIFKSETPLIKIMQKLISALPANIMLNLANAKCSTVSIAKGTNACSIDFDGNCSLVSAVIESSGFDVSSLCTTSYDETNTTTTVKFNTDVGFPYPDTLKIYVKAA